MATANAKRKSKKVTLNEVDENTWLLISYRRFSSERQKHGRSEDRQKEAFELFVAKIKREFPSRSYLTHSLPMDRGMSAFYGEHRKRGHLGKFVEAIESGEISVIPGRTILFVEEVKRLSREGAKEALQHTIFKVFDAGITLRFESGVEFNNEKNASAPGWLGVLTTLLDVAHKDSSDKKDWLTDVWDNRRKRARATGELVVGTVPSWLEIVGRERNGDKVIDFGRCEVNPQAAKAVVKMFKWAAEGLGYNLITQRLNREAKTKDGWIPTKRKNQSKDHWNRRYVQLILRNRAVIGEYQPHRRLGGKYSKRVPDGQPILNFYPNILKNHPGLFDLVQQKIASKRGISQPGPKAKNPNVLSRMVKCGYCGGPMHCGPRGRGNHHYLYCADNVTSGDSRKCPSLPYQICEDALLDQLRRLRPESVLPKKDKKQKLCDKLRRQEHEITANIVGIEKQIENFYDQIGRTKDAESRDDYEKLIVKLRSEKRVAKQQQVDLRYRRQEAERDANSVEEWKSGLDDLRASLRDGNQSTRERLREHLGQFVDRIEIFAKGYPDNFLNDGEDNLLDYFSDARFESECQGVKSAKLTQREKRVEADFEDWSLSQLKSRKARFLRVHFRQQDTIDEKGRLRHVVHYMDVTPEGSIGGSSDAIKQLREQFEVARTKRKPR